MSTSLIAQDAGAPFLFSAEEMGLDYIGAPERKGQYTAEELFRDRPEIYREIVRLLAAKEVSIRGIKRVCKVHHCTIRAVATREGETIDTLRLSMGRRALEVGALLIEEIEEDIVQGNLKPGEKSFALVALVDKGQVLTGGATARIDNMDAPEKEGFEGWLAKAKPANVREIESSPVEMGSEGGADLHCPPAAAPAAAPPARESISVVPREYNREKGEDVTAFDTDAGPSITPEQTENDQGGRGSSL